MPEADPTHHTEDLTAVEANASDAPAQVEKINFSGPAVWGFYGSCTVVGIGVTVAASSLIVFGDKSWSATTATVAIVVTAVASVLCWWTLAKARGDRA